VVVVPRRYNTVSQRDRDRIVELVLSGRFRLGQIAVHTGVGEAAVRRVIVDAGLSVRGVGPPTPRQAAHQLQTSEMIWLRTVERLSYSEIGERFAMTGPGVRARFATVGFNGRRAPERQDFSVVDRVLERWWDHDRNSHQIALRTGLCERDLEGRRKALGLVGYVVVAERVVFDERREFVCRALRAAADSVGTVTTVSYDAWRMSEAAAGRVWPSSSVVRRGFRPLRSWPEICAAAGLGCEPRGPRSGSRLSHNTVVEVVGAYLDFVWAAGEDASANGFDAWIGSWPGERFSASAIRYRFGSRVKAVRTVHAERNGHID
jgi:hypothetical protein